MENLRVEYKNINELRKNMSVIKHLGGAVISNYFNQCNHCSEKLKSWILEKAMAFEWIDGGIKRIYFYSIDKDELVKVLSFVDSGSVVDYITKDMEESADIFVKAGFRMHLEYGRFCVKPKTEEEQKLYNTLHDDERIENEIFKSKYGEKAVVSDAEEIDKQLREVFDPYEAHFYSMEKLREHIRKGWVWVAKENEHIIAADLFEIQGKKSYGAYLYNNGDVNVMCSLIAKVEDHISTLGVSYYYCWMRLNNKRIIRYNMKYNGFVPDGLYDIIYVKE